MISQNEKISKAGYRLTLPRKTILSAVTNIPLTAQEIFGVLNKNNKAPDLVTVYRNLELLTKLGLITKVQFEDSSIRYEVAGDEHHHHLICEECGSIEDIPLEEEFLLTQVTRHTSFKVKRHHLEFFGVCNNCQ